MPKTKLLTRDFIKRKNLFPPKNMTISHPRLFKKAPDTYAVIAYCDRLCSKTALKLEHQNTEIN